VKLRQIYANLEDMVADRTRRLEAALNELWGEMALAKKIQTSLVPPEPRLEGCQVAATMQPAEQVGGDYYDVVRTPHNEWVLIGDVSGHGVTSGLVMMMCQVAVRTALQADPTMSPARLLSLVNRTLTDNIRLLGEKKYLTITALCRTGRTFTYSGLHQDLLIYRAASQRLERLETRGLWLGIEASIDQLLQVDTFELAPDDVLLLYTDGLTEAVRGGKMLDLEGLSALLSRLATRDAAGIVSGIMEELASFERSDDVSAVVVKQLDLAPSLRTGPRGDARPGSSPPGPLA
jgi:serine phosphatase RsbU (regulator of sigma subunit)